MNIDQKFLKENLSIHDNLQILGDSQFDGENYYLAVKDVFEKRFGHDWRFDQEILKDLGLDTENKYLPFAAQIEYRIGLGYSTDDEKLFKYDDKPELHDFKILKVHSLREDLSNEDLMDFILSSDSTLNEIKEESEEYMNLFKDFEL